VSRGDGAGDAKDLVALLVGAVEVPEMHPAVDRTGLVEGLFGLAVAGCVNKAVV
jgi:hypothetical protein